MAKRAWALIALAGGTAALAYYAPRGADDGSQPAAGAGSTAAPRQVFRIPQNLPERRAMSLAKGELFDTRSVAPPPPPPAAPAQARPELPPNPYQFAGTSSQGGKLKVWLGIGDRVYEARAGEMLDDEWRVKSVTGDAVVLLHVPLKVEQRLEADSKITADRR